MNQYNFADPRNMTEHMLNNYRNNRAQAVKFARFYNNPVFGEGTFLSYYFTMIAMMIGSMIIIGERPFNWEDQLRIGQMYAAMNHFVGTNHRIVGILLARRIGA